MLHICLNTGWTFGDFNVVFKCASFIRFRVFLQAKLSGQPQSTPERGSIGVGVGGGQVATIRTLCDDREGANSARFRSQLQRRKPQDGDGKRKADLRRGVGGGGGAVTPSVASQSSS